MTATQAIETLLDTDALIVRRTQSRTLLRFAPPDALDPRVGIKVDLGAARLDMRVDGRLFETGPARIVGLWSEDEGWRWPWHDAHIPRAATADVEPALRTHAGLSPWLGPEPIAMPELETAMQLGAWVAARWGALGAWPWEPEPGQVRLVAFRPAPPGKAFDVAACRWCIGCGNDDEPLHVFAPGHGLCAACIEQMLEIRDELPDGLSGSRPLPRHPCIVCGQMEPGIMLALASVGDRCIAALPRPKRRR